MLDFNSVAGAGLIASTALIAPPEKAVLDFNFAATKEVLLRSALGIAPPEKAVLDFNGSSASAHSSEQTIAPPEKAVLDFNNRVKNPGW